MTNQDRTAWAIATLILITIICVPMSRLEKASGLIISALILINLSTKP